MIYRAMQRSSQGVQTIGAEQIIKFNRLITVWPPYNPSFPNITYNESTGTFTIPHPELNDFLITWTVSLRTSSVLDRMCEVFLLRIKYGNGEVTEGNFSCCTTGTGIMKSFKILHVIRIADIDFLTFQLVNNGFYNDMYLTTPNYPYPSGINVNHIYNCNICIISI